MQAGVVGSGRSIYVASVFIMNIGLARMLGIEGFGAFQQVFMFSAIFMMFTLGLPETMFYFLPRLTDKERPRFLGQTIMMMGITGIVVGMILWYGAPSFARVQNNQDIVTGLRLFGIYGAFLIASSFADPLFIIFKKVGYLFSITVGHGLFFVGITVWNYVAQPPLDSLFMAMAVFGAVKWILSLVMVLSMKPVTGPVWFRQGRSMVLLQLTFALPLALTAAIEIISRWMDKFVVSVMFGPETLGVFYVGAIELPFVGVLVSSVYSVVAPVLNTHHHKGDTEAFTRMVINTLKFISKFIWPVFAYLVVFADHLVPLVFSGAYDASVPPFRIYLLLMPLRIASYGVIVVALGRPRVIFWSALAALVMNAVLNIVLALQIGYTGPAVATVVSSYFHVFLLVYIIMHELHIGIDELLPVTHFLAVGVTCGLAVLIAYGLTWAIEGDLSTVVSSALIFTGAYLFLGFKAGFIRLAELKSLIRRRGGGASDDSA